LEFLNSLSKMANQNRKPAAILLLDYDTAPASQYPRQLTQAVEFLRYTTTTLNHAPSSIILAGDSAGGSLILGLLGHILHPHPSISPLMLKEPLRGAAMSSPVVDLDFSKPSFARARLIDPAPVSTLDKWMADYVGAGDYADVEDFYLQPGRALALWWEGSEQAVDEILIAAAEKEGMVGDISNCAGKIQVSHTIFHSTIESDCGIGERVKERAC
jgi:acetyl esterase/lipase